MDSRPDHTRWLAGGLISALVLCAQAPAAQQPTFKGRSDVVRVFVTVTDRDGRLVTTLAQTDFELKDEGKPQSIVLFDNTPQPIRLIVMLDVSGSMEGNLPILREASQELFGRLRPDDRARVGSFGREVSISDEFTQDVRALDAALPQTIVPDAPTPLWRALDQAMTAFGHEGDERRAILVLSDGKDSGQLQFSLKGHPASQAEVIDRARRELSLIHI